MSENYYFSKQTFKFGTEYNTLSRWRCKITVSDNIIIQRILMKKSISENWKRMQFFFFILPELHQLVYHTALWDEKHKLLMP